jgi:hypothetical protein
MQRFAPVRGWNVIQLLVLKRCYASWAADNQALQIDEDLGVQLC